MGIGRISEPRLSVRTNRRRLAADEVDSGMPYRDLSLAKNRTFVKNDAGHIDYLQGYLLRHIHEDRLIGRIQAHAFLDGLDAGWRIRFIRVLRIYGVYRGDRCFRIRGRRGCSGNNLHLYLATNRLIIRIGRRKSNLLLTGGRSAVSGLLQANVPATIPACPPCKTDSDSFGRTRYRKPQAM